MKRNKMVTAREAVAAIRDGAVLAAAGFVGNGTPEEILIELERAFLADGRPRDLTLLFSSGLGDGKERGLNRLAHPGMLARVIAGHYGLMPKIARMAVEDEFAAYNLPQGMLTNFYRAVAGRTPGVLTRVGLGTFADPRLEGGKVNAMAAAAGDLVEVVTMGGEEYLWMKAFPIDVAIIRGTTADTTGNITMEKEILSLDTLAMATAVHTSGGIVIAQVERVADTGTLRAKDVKVPGILVDHVVVARPENHMQTYATHYNPAYAGEIRVPLAGTAPLPLDERKVIARRAAHELRPYDVINLGIGVPEAVGAVANEEQILGFLTMTVEPGIIGGMPVGGLDFGASVNAQAVIDMPDQFNFYDGGGLSLACLGWAQIDGAGNVNSSKFGPRLAGCGGFIDISQNARTVVFAGTFTAGDLAVTAEDGRLTIDREGRHRKFVERVDQVTFSGAHGAASGRRILYVTERCVFRLTPRSTLELLELAPGVDLERDVLAHMDFRPEVAPRLRTMDERIFQRRTMGIRAELLARDLRSRIVFDAGADVLRLNFKGLEIEHQDDLEAIRTVVESVCSDLGRQVKAVVDYDGFKIPESLLSQYTSLVEYIVSTYYIDVKRHTTSPYVRMTLGDAVGDMYDSREEAERAL